MALCALNVFRVAHLSDARRAASTYVEHRRPMRRSPPTCDGRIHGRAARLIFTAPLLLLLLLLLLLCTDETFFFNPRG